VYDYLIYQVATKILLEWRTTSCQTLLSWSISSTARMTSKMSKWYFFSSTFVKKLHVSLRKLLKPYSQLCLKVYYSISKFPFMNVASNLPDVSSLLLTNQTQVFCFNRNILVSIKSIKFFFSFFEGLLGFIRLKIIFWWTAFDFLNFYDIIN
jgi:hypothetical protein